MVIAVIIAGVVSFAGELVFRTLFYSNWSGGWGGGSSRSSSNSSSGSSDKKGGGAFLIIVIALVLIVLAWILSVVIKMALSRSRETLADAGAVELTKNPDAMISALRKIEGRGELPGATSAVMEMCVDNPREEFADLFATHPSVDSRVAALVKYAGGHDPGKYQEPPPETDSHADSTDTPEEASPTALPGTIPGRSPGPHHAPQQSAPDNSTGPWGTRPKG